MKAVTKVRKVVVCNDYRRPAVRSCYYTKWQASSQERSNCTNAMEAEVKNQLRLFWSAATQYGFSISMRVTK